MIFNLLNELTLLVINPLSSPSEGAPELKYGDVNTETTSRGEVKGLIITNNFAFHQTKFFGNHKNLK